MEPRVHRLCSDAIEVVTIVPTRMPLAASSPQARDCSQHGTAMTIELNTQALRDEIAAGYGVELAGELFRSVARAAR